MQKRRVYPTSAYWNFIYFITPCIYLYLRYTARSSLARKSTFTCSVASVVKIHSKSPRFMHRLPGRRRAVLIVGVDIVVVHILSGEHGGPGGAAHGGSHKSVGEGGPPMLHNLSCFVHDLQGPQLHILVIGEHKDNVGSDVFSFLLYPSSEPLGSDSRTEGPQQFCAQDRQNQGTARILHCVWSNVAKLTKRLSLLASAGLGSQGKRERER